LQFSQEEDVVIKKTLAASIHEAFLLCNPDDDNSKLRECFKNLLEDTDKEIIKALVDHLDLSISRYCNESSIKSINLSSPKNNGSSAST
jgi:hypothetical protein